MSTPSSGKVAVSNKTAMALLAVLVLAAIALVLWFQFGGNEDVNDDPLNPTSSQTTEGSQHVPPSTSNEKATTNSNPQDSKQTTGTTNLPGQINGKDPMLNGNPYSKSNEAMKEWMPVRVKFIRGLVSSGNIYDQIKGTATPEVEEKVKKIPDGKYKDVKFPAELITPGKETAEPFKYTEEIFGTKGEKFTITVEYIPTGNSAEWKVSQLNIG